MLSCCVHQVSDGWRVFLLLSLCLQLVSWTLIIYWSQYHWHNHPISRALQAHVQPPYSSWGSVATSINTEFRRIDKFATGAPGARVIITDSWVLKVCSNLLSTIPLLSHFINKQEKKRVFPYVLNEKVSNSVSLNTNFLSTFNKYKHLCILTRGFLAMSFNEVNQRLTMLVSD